MTQAPEKTKKIAKKKVHVTEGRAYVLASYNNTIVTITDPEGKVICSTSSGSCGFKGTRKATPHAAQVAAEKAVEKAKAMGFTKAHVYLKGIGAGREQALRGLNQAGLHIESIRDRTAIPHNGCRPRRARRV